MRQLVAPITALMLVGCGKLEVQGCESYIKSMLRSPATFQRREVQIADRTSSAEEINELGGSAHFSQPQTKWGIRTVSITYDAANAHGTPIRAREICQFKLRDGELTATSQSIDAGIRRIKMMRDMRELAGQGAIPNLTPKDLPAPETLSCCM